MPRREKPLFTLDDANRCIDETQAKARDVGHHRRLAWAAGYQRLAEWTNVPPEMRDKLHAFEIRESLIGRIPTHPLSEQSIALLGDDAQDLIGSGTIRPAHGARPEDHDKIVAQFHRLLPAECLTDTVRGYLASRQYNEALFEAIGENHRLRAAFLAAHPAGQAYERRRHEVSDYLNHAFILRRQRPPSA